MHRIEGPSRVRAVLEPVTARLERLEHHAKANSDDIRRIKAAARLIGMNWFRYLLILALTVISPKDAIKRVLNYIDAAQATYEEDGPTADDMA